MKRTIGLVLLGVCVLVLPLLMSCVADENTTPSNPIATQDYVDKAVAKVQTDVDKKATVSYVDQKFGLVPAAGNSYQKSETYSKSEVDQKIADAIKALKDDKSWVKGTTTNATNPSTGGTVTVITSPTSIEVMGSSQYCFTAVLQNTTTNWVYIRPTISINLHTGQNPLSTNLDAGDVAITGGGGSTNYVDADFQAIGTASSIQLTPIHMGGVGTGEIQLGANSNVSILICIQMEPSVESRIWDVSVSVNWRSL